MAISLSLRILGSEGKKEVDADDNKYFFIVVVISLTHVVLVIETLHVRYIILLLLKIKPIAH